MRMDLCVCLQNITTVVPSDESHRGACPREALRHRPTRLTNRGVGISGSLPELAYALAMVESTELLSCSVRFMFVHNVTAS